MMKKIPHLIEGLLLLAVAILVLAQMPHWLSQYEIQGQKAPGFSALNLKSEKVSFPVPDSKSSVIVFWATWCGPCNVELSRFKQAVKDHRLDGHRVLAVSIGEPVDLVAKIARERDYPFVVWADPSGLSSSLYKVSGTPTVIHI